MSGKVETVGFGAKPDSHVFEVRIPEAKRGLVTIIEDYGPGALSGPVVVERAVLQRDVWDAIKTTARDDFNARLKAKRLHPSRWTVGVNVLDRLLGKELTVLAWAAEQARNQRDLDKVCRAWSALRPEERWWLYSMAVSTPSWRRALYVALADPEPEAIVIGTRAERKEPKWKKRQSNASTPPTQLALYAALS